jgi:membrane-associated phospholipid phosphatase
MASRLEAEAEGHALILVPGKPGSPSGTVLGFPLRAWSPRLRAVAVLAEFATLDWTSGTFAALPPPDTHAVLAKDVKTLRDRIPDRAARLEEILAQADGFDDYLLQLLGGGPRPAAAAIVAAAVAIGQMVGMHWKWTFQRARPAQVYPALVPVIATPPHASYPSNHALQSRLAALALSEIFPAVQGDAAATALHEAHRLPLLLMADRIAENREVAGVHFPSDSQEGKDLADRLLPLLRGLGSFSALLEEARAEAGLRAAGPKPQGF